MPWPTRPLNCEAPRNFMSVAAPDRCVPDADGDSASAMIFCNEYQQMYLIISTLLHTSNDDNNKQVKTDESDNACSGSCNCSFLVGQSNQQKRPAVRYYTSER